MPPPTPPSFVTHPTASVRTPPAADARAHESPSDSSPSSIPSSLVNVLEHRTMARPIAPIQSSFSFSESAYIKKVVSGVDTSSAFRLCALYSADLTVIHDARSIMPWGVELSVCQSRDDRGPTSRHAIREEDTHKAKGG